ncbi:ANTAR domain-containing protein [Amycolatopsis sp. BJA-103]|uniref:ANTAR domain-containing protein n=1 Tax=unclassified Amycolatopsis TaxID=2618356 RepID=UPI000C78E77B|nr:ANTAR domain-containing protein [Amycolatopsis sp. BJA-103]AUI62255.1 transcription antitermination regulator [Amycolatopsis sp. BJA-103]PNE20439.1 transcription antitermination regulator [Amycolatopsis sp. BJA-103]
MWDGTGGRYDPPALRRLIETERGRADRAAAVARRHECLTETASASMRPFHVRMAELHRATEHKHRAAADLHTGYLDAVGRWADRPQEPAVLPPAFMTAAAETSGIRSLAVALFTTDGTEASVVVSDPIAARAHDLEYSLGEGPSRGTPLKPGVCGEPELVSRWPQFGPAVREIGVRAVVSAPLGLDGVPMGSLTAYRSEPAPDAEVARSLEVLAGALTGTALDPGIRLDGDDGLPVHPLFGDVDVCVVTHQATGVVMANHDCSAADALALIRAHAFARNETVTELARAIVARTYRLS